MLHLLQDSHHELYHIRICIKLKSHLSVHPHLISHVYLNNAASITVSNQALFTRLRQLEVSSHCCLPSAPHSAPGSTYILVKTAATTALLLACTTFKPKVQGSNPANDNFSSHYHVYALMLASVGVLKAQLYATRHSLNVGQA